MRPLLFAGAALLWVCPAASAQPYIGSTAPRRGSIEIGAAGLWNGGHDAGGRSASETPNGSGGAAPLTLFTATSRVRPSLGGDARVAVYLSARTAVEGTLQYSRPILEVRLANDFENAAPVTAEGQVTSYIAGASLLYHFGTGRLVPFVSGGGGYVRQLHEDNADLVTGSEIHAGGGLKYWFGARRRRFGLRLDAQASARTRSAEFEQKRRILPAVAGGLTYLF